MSLRNYWKTLFSKYNTINTWVYKLIIDYMFYVRTMKTLKSPPPPPSQKYFFFVGMALNDHERFYTHTYFMLCSRGLHSDFNKQRFVIFKAVVAVLFF